MWREVICNGNRCLPYSCTIIERPLSIVGRRRKMERRPNDAPRNASIYISNAETDGLPVVVDQTPVPRMHVSPAVYQITEVSYSNNNRKNHTSKSSFRSTLPAQSRPWLAIRGASIFPVSSSLKYRTLSTYSSPFELSGM